MAWLPVAITIHVEGLVTSSIGENAWSISIRNGVQALNVDVRVRQVWLSASSNQSVQELENGFLLQSN